jgi:hypothetical protein
LLASFAAGECDDDNRRPNFGRQLLYPERRRGVIRTSGAWKAKTQEKQQDGKSR